MRFPFARFILLASMFLSFSSGGRDYFPFVSVAGFRSLSRPLAQYCERCKAHKYLYYGFLCCFAGLILLAMRVPLHHNSNIIIWWQD
ncbi:hypothetical protein P8452_66731 [Trifolium repens]|nr:hypothetical protein P8452_66731 [Trifolium repens]